MLTPERPSITRHVQRLLGGDDLGTLLYSYLSAISHGTIWGLVQRAEPLDPTASGPVVAAGLVVSEKDIAMLAVALITAHITAFGGYAKLVGWEVPAWQAAVVRVAPLVTSYSSRYAGADM